ncbi:hypothetical protein D1872_279310 [compost metagenome]
MPRVFQHQIRAPVLLVPADPENPILHHRVGPVVLDRQFLAESDRNDIDLAYPENRTQLPLQKLRLHDGLVHNAVERLHHFVPSQRRVGEAVGKQNAFGQKQIKERKTRHRIDHMLDPLGVNLIQHDIVVDEVALFMFVARYPVMAADIPLG